MELEKEKTGHVLHDLFSTKNIFKICALSQCIVYWIHFQNLHTFTYQNTLRPIPFCLFLKWLKTFTEYLTCRNMLPQFVSFVIEVFMLTLSFMSYIKGIQPISSCESTMTWSRERKIVSPFSLKQWSSILARL